MKFYLTFFIFILVSSVEADAQSDIYSTKGGSIHFFSNAPLEDIEAKNTQAISLLNTRNNEIAVRVPIRQFQFRNKLMQEHFNENYMESERFPHATFKGKINESIKFDEPGTYKVTATGILNLHGINQKRTLNGVLKISKGQMLLETKFDVLLADHDIKIPKLVFNKIAERIAVNTSFAYSPQVK